MISIATIYRAEDEFHLPFLEETLPANSEWIRVLTKPVPRDLSRGTLRKTMESKKTTLSRGITAIDLTYEYSDFSFAEAKNFALQNATKDWVLLLDTDDRLVNEPYAFDNLSSLPKNVGGIFCYVLSLKVADGKHTHELGEQIRLIRNGRSFQYVNRVHEQIYPSIINKGFSAIRSTILIKHTGYEIAEGSNMADKFKRNIKLMIKELNENPGNLYIHEMLHGAYKDLANNGLLGYYENNEHIEAKLNILQDL